MARKISVEIVGDASSLERAFSKSSRSAKRFQGDMDRTSRKTSRGFSRMRSSLGAGIAGVGVASLVKDSIQGASDLEQQISKTNVVFGDSAKAVEDWSKTLASSFGLSEREALTLASTFGALFAPLGIVGQQAANQSEGLVQLGADLASFYNTDVKDALAAVQSGLVGQARPLRRYGVLLDAARVQQKALVMTGKEHAADLTNTDKVLARIAIIYKDTAKAQGDFARTQDQAAQQAKIAQANFSNLEDELGTGLVPALAAATKEANKLFAAFKPGHAGGSSFFHKSGLQLLQDFSEHLPGGDWSKRHRLPFTRGNRPDARPVFGPPVPPGLFARQAQAARVAKELSDAQKAARKAAREAAAAAAARVRQSHEAARQEALDRASFAVDKTAATKTLKDDLAALRRYNAMLTRRVKGGHGTLELEREQFRVQMQIADVLKQQADLAKRTSKRLGVDVTRFQKSARGQFVVPGGGGRGVVIAGGVHLHGVQNVGDMENQLARRSKQRAHARRGTR